MDFDQRIRSARERSNVLVILGDIEKALQSPSNRKQLVDSLCSAALIPSFVGVLTAGEFERKFARLFTSLSLSAAYTLSRLISRLSEADLTPFAFDRLLAVLEHAERDLVGRLLRENDSEETRHLTSMLCSLPDRIANFVGVQKLSHSQAVAAVRSHWESVFEAFTESLEKNPCGDVQAMFLVKIGLQNEEIFKRLISWFYYAKNPLSFGRLILKRSIFDRREIEQILIKLAASSLAGSDLFDKLLGDSIKVDDIVRKLYTEKIHIQRLIPHRISDKLAVYASKHSVARDGLIGLMKIWADQAKMICLVDVAYQIQLSKAVLNFGKVVYKNSSDAEREDISVLVRDCLLTAMGDFLNVSEVYRRQMGMFVAETLCSWFSTASLTFEYEDDDLLRELKAVVAEESEQQMEKIVKEMKMTHIVVPPSSSQAKPELDSDDEEEFEAYNTEETPREARNDLTTESSHSLAMYYIRDCLDGLEDEKDPTRFKNAMSSLEALILRRAIGFDDLALKIAQKMVYLKDIFHMDSFEGIRVRILKACVVMRPDLAPSLIRIMYGKTVTLEQRYLIMDVIDSAVATLKEERKVTGNPQAVTSIIYSFMDFDNSTQHLDFYNEDHAVLAKTYYIIGKLVRTLSALPCCLRVSRSVALSLRFVRNHPRSNVLQSALLCYSAIVDAIPKSVLLSEMTEDLKEWIEFLVNLLEHDQRTKNCESFRMDLPPSTSRSDNGTPSSSGKESKKTPSKLKRPSSSGSSVKRPSTSTSTETPNKKKKKEEVEPFQYLVMDKVGKQLCFLDQNFDAESSERFVVVQKVTESFVNDKFGHRFKPVTLKDYDNSTHCDRCNCFYNQYCLIHPILFVPDRQRAPGDPDEFDKNGEKLTKSEFSLPPFLEIKTSDIPNAGKGVFTKVDIPTGTCFGPYKGEVRSQENTKGYMWMIKKVDGTKYYRDGLDRNKGNWMRYINSARVESEQNVIAFQFTERIFYRVFRPIPTGKELLVWYGDEFGEDLGIDKKPKSFSVKGKGPPKYNPFVF